MYNSQYYTCEQIDQRLLQGYLDDYNTQNNTNLTKEEFLTKLLRALDLTFISQVLVNNNNTVLSSSLIYDKVFKIGNLTTPDLDTLFETGIYKYSSGTIVIVNNYSEQAIRQVRIGTHLNQNIGMEVEYRTYDGTEWGNWIKYSEKTETYLNPRLFTGSYSASSELDSKLETGIWQSGGAIVIIRKYSNTETRQLRLSSLSSGAISLDWRTHNGTEWSSWTSTSIKYLRLVSDIDTARTAGFYIRDVPDGGGYARNYVFVHKMSNNGKIVQFVIEMRDTKDVIIKTRESVDDTTWGAWKTYNDSFFDGFDTSNHLDSIVTGGVYKIHNTDVSTISPSILIVRKEGSNNINQLMLNAADGQHIKIRHSTDGGTTWGDWENYLSEEFDELNKGLEGLIEVTKYIHPIDFWNSELIYGYVGYDNKYTASNTADGFLINVEGYDKVNIIMSISNSAISMLSDSELVDGSYPSWATGWNSRRSLNVGNNFFDIPSDAKYILVPHLTTSTQGISPDNVILYKEKHNIIRDYIEPIKNIIGSSKEGTPVEVAYNWPYSLDAAGRVQSVGQSKNYIVEVEPNSKITLKSDYSGVYVLLKHSPITLKPGELASICEGCEPRYNIPVGTNEIITPSDCYYIAITHSLSTGEDQSPYYVSIQKGLLGTQAEFNNLKNSYTYTPSTDDDNYHGDRVITAATLKWISGTNGIWLIKIPEGCNRIFAKSRVDANNCLAFLKTNVIRVGEDAEFADNTSLISLTGVGQEINIPSDAKYIYTVRFGGGVYINPSITFYNFGIESLYRAEVTDPELSEEYVEPSDEGQTIDPITGLITLTNMPNLIPVSDPLSALASGESNFYHEVATGLVYMVCVEGFDHPYEAFDCCALYVFSLTNPNNVKRYQVAAKLDNTRKCYTNNIVPIDYKKVRVFYTYRYEDSGYCWYRDFDFVTETFTEPQKAILSISGDITNVVMDSNFHDGDVLTGNMVRKFTNDNGGTTGVSGGQFVYIQKITEPMADGYRYATLCCGESISYNLILVRSDDNFESIELVAVLPYLTRYDCAVAGLNNKLYFVHRVAGDEYAASSGSALFTADITDINNIVWSVDTKFAEGDSRTDCYLYKNEIYLMAGNYHSVSGRPMRVSSSVWKGTSDDPSAYTKVLVINDSRGVQNPRIFRYGAGDYGVLLQNSPARVDYANGYTGQWQFKTAVCFVHTRIN